MANCLPTDSCEVRSIPEKRFSGEGIGVAQARTRERSPKANKNDDFLSIEVGNTIVSLQEKLSIFSSYFVLLVRQFIGRISSLKATGPKTSLAALSLKEVYFEFIQSV